MQIVTPDKPYLTRDFRQGRYTPYSISQALVPQNSVSFSKNINFDTVVGSAAVRAGTTSLGSFPALSPTSAPIGIGEFVTPGSFPGVAPLNRLMVVFCSDITTLGNSANAYCFDGVSWQNTNLQSVLNTPWRFATLGGRIFAANISNMRSSADGITWGVGSTNDCIDTASAGDLIHRFAGRLLTSGNQTYPDRVFFSSIISQNASPFITWNTDSVTGDWIDINPDDGGKNTGFAEVAAGLLVFKSNGIYLLDTVNKSTEPQNIFNIGAVSQEAIVTCQGIAYFFTGIDIRQTDGTTTQPAQISRFGVQDIIDAIPQTNWSSVTSGTDGLNVYFSVGTVTIDVNKDTERTLVNCVIKFSPRDLTWSVHSYARKLGHFTQYTTATSGRLMQSAIYYNTDVQTINLGTTDSISGSGQAISFELESQDLEFGSRAHLKKMSDKIIVYTNDGIDSTVQLRVDGKNVTDVSMQNNKRVNIGSDVDVQGNFFNFRWTGSSSGTPPVLEGFEIQKVTDLGINTI